MIILSNCLTETVDEGCRKVACSLIGRVKKAEPNTTVITYQSGAGLGDVHLKINKWMLNGKLARLLRQKKEPLLYVPAPAKMHAAAIRIFILSLFARWGLQVILAMTFPVGKIDRLLLRWSGARIITLSRDAWEHYRQAIGDQAEYFKTGVDTTRFCPVDSRQKEALRKKYGIPPGKRVALHVGHLRTERNVQQLLKLDESWHAVLVVSTLTAAEQNETLRAQLESAENVTLIDWYLPNIEQLYQLADVYLFPVVQAHGCIDVPLSALEAAACGIPVVATAYGELKELIGKPGFYGIDSFEPERLNAVMQVAASESTDPRQSVLEYDWKNAVQQALII
jgi:glycosyltransferase involved in cell wall biosynthesis